MKNLPIVIASLIVAVVASIGTASIVSQHGSTTVTEKVGALAGPSIPSPYLQWGGVTQWNTLQPMAAATTTICAFQSPAATSTLDTAFYTISTGTSTAATIDLATSTNAFATTTNLVQASSFNSNTTGSIVWQSSGTNGIIAPLTWIVVKTAGVGLSGYTYGGTCGGTFTQLSY